MPEKHTRKAGNKGTTKKKKKIRRSHIGHCTHTVEKANVKVRNVFHRQNNVTCSTNCKYRTTATLYALETWFVSGK